MSLATLVFLNFLKIIGALILIAVLYYLDRRLK